MDRLSKDSSLVGHFTFENGNCHDRAGRVPTISSAGYAAGYTQKSKRIASSNGDAVILSPVSHLAPPKLTVRARFICTSLSNPNSANGIFHVGSAAFNSGYAIFIENTGWVDSYMYNSAISSWDVITNYTEKIRLNIPYEVVTVYDGTFHRLFINGILRNQNPIIFGNTGIDTGMIGQALASDYKMSGGIIESIEVYKRPKSPAEIYTEYQLWKTRNSPDTPIHYFVGVVNVTPSAQTVEPASINPINSFGVPNVKFPELATLEPGGIASAQAVGIPSMANLFTNIVFPPDSIAAHFNVVADFDTVQAAFNVAAPDDSIMASFRVIPDIFTEYLKNPQYPTGGVTVA